MSPSSLLSDIEIKELCHSFNMISPFVQSTVRKIGQISYGLSSTVYDVRLQSKIQMFSSNSDQILDPVSPCSEYTEINAEHFIMPPHSFALGLTIETFNMPNNIMALCLGKSTYARYGIIINPTCIMPGMSGNIVIEISNTCPRPVKIYTGENHGICSFVFLRSSKCESVYDGQYQNQTKILHPGEKAN